MKKNIDNKKIDKLLHELEQAQAFNPIEFDNIYNEVFVNEKDFHQNAYKAYLEELLHLNLISYNDTKSFMHVTSFGKKIIREGGWYKHCDEKEVKANEDSELRKLEVYATVSSAQSAKKATLAAWISILITLIACAITYFQYNDSKNKDSNIEKNEARIDSLKKDIIELQKHKK